MNTSARRLAALLVLAGFALVPARTVVAEGPKPDGPGGRPHRVHALVGAIVVVRPGEMLERATVVIRDGVIEAVGADVTAPPDARVWDARGLTIYPGLVEPYLKLEGGAPTTDDDEDKPPPPKVVRKGATHENGRVRPDRLMAEELELSEETLKGLRKAGFTAALVVPGAGVLRGESALVSLRDGSAREQVILPRVAQHVALERGGWGTREYPGSLMGAIALARQTLADAKHHAAATKAYAANPMGQERPQANVSLEALAGVLAHTRPVVLEAEDAQMLLRGTALLGEFDLVPTVVLGGHDAHRWLDAVVGTGAPLIVSLNFPPPPRWDDADEADTIPLADLRGWWLAPEEPARLERAGARLAFTTQGLEDRGDWRARARAAIARGLSEDTALAAFTTAPAALLRAPQLGVIAQGGLANLTITDGPLFAKETKIVEVWVDGARYDLVPDLPEMKDLAGVWQVALEGGGLVRVRLEHERGALKARLGDGEGGEPSVARLWRDRLEVVVPAALAGTDVEATLTLRVDGNRLVGRYRVGSRVGEVVAARQGEVFGRRLPDEKRRKEKDGDDEPEEPAPYTPAVTIGPWPTWPPLPEPAPPAVLVRGAMLWTLGPGGTFKGDLLVRDGAIAAIGTSLEAPAGALVIDGAGRHVTPGITDCHSHSFIDGGVNEGTHSCTAEVRIADVVDAERVDIYRQLAGGVTTSNQLHGSANAIGGQNAVVQLRWGQPASGLLLEGAKSGIKFALGENPKRSNWGHQLEPRYPTSRSGVEELIRERFLAARNYRRERDAYLQAEDTTKVPPRVDLQLEALAEILEGERLVHCHSYRQDEILAMVRLAEEFGFTVATFQHVLEGYKVARELAAHGAGASTFSDWWAYKFEVYDAIAYNAALMVRAGVLTSINSDDSEMARRLNQEAGKTVRYGGLPEADALALVTLNPIKQLALGERLGSLEVGKQADFAVWSAPPLSMQALCDETWIAGRRYWDRLGRDREARALLEAERRELLRAAAVARWSDEDGPKPGAWRPTFGRRMAETEAERGHALHQGCCVDTHDGEAGR
jgi:imidazolonepropionase-like amidohydrolase